MTKLSEARPPHFGLTESAAPATPAAGEFEIYAATDGTLHTVDDAGTDTNLHASGGLTEHAYVTRTTNLVVASSTEATPTDVLSTTVDVGSDEVDIEFFCPDGYMASAGGQVILNLWEDSTNVGRMAYVWSESGRQHHPVFASYRYTPGSGSKTFKIAAWEPGGSAELRAGAAGVGIFVPMYLKITSTS